MKLIKTISKIIRYVKSKRSMKKIEGSFRDVVNGKQVFFYVDCFDDKYMAQSKYGFRVKSSWRNRF